MSAVYVYMHKVARTRGVWGHAPPGNALRLLLRPLWDRSRAAVHGWLTEYWIQFSAVHITHLLVSQLSQTQPTPACIAIFPVRNTESDQHWGQLGLAC